MTDFVRTEDEKIQEMKIVIKNIFCPVLDKIRNTKR